MDKESVIRAMASMTQFDLHEIFQSLKDLPHQIAKEGFYFDMDAWPDERVRALWENLQERRKRINDVWSSERKRSDFLGALSVEFAHAAPVETGRPNYVVDDNGKRTRVVRFQPYSATTGHRLPRAHEDDECEVVMIPAKVSRAPTLSAMLKKRKATFSKQDRLLAKKKKAMVPSSTTEPAESDSSSEEEVETVETPVSDEEDWTGDDPRLREDSSSDGDSLGGLF